MLKIVTRIVTPFQQNCRILGCTDTNKAVVLDPGGDIEKINTALQMEGWSCDQIWLTHSHIDHCGGVKALKKKTNAKLFAHRAGSGMRASVQDTARLFGIVDNSMQNCPEPEHYMQDREVLSIGEHQFRVLFTPGHSQDHVALFNWKQGILLAGDTLFAGTIGRTDLPGGDHDQLLDSIRIRIFTLPPETVVMSGHGPDTSVKVEMETNPFFVEDKRNNG